MEEYDTEASNSIQEQAERMATAVSWLMIRDEGAAEVVEEVGNQQLT